MREEGRSLTRVIQPSDDEFEICTSFCVNLVASSVMIKTLRVTKNNNDCMKRLLMCTICLLTKEGVYFLLLRHVFFRSFFLFYSRDCNQGNIF